MPTRNLPRKGTAAGALFVILAFAFAPVTAFADTIVRFVLENHPAGALSPPPYGLRLDYPVTGAFNTFSFDDVTAELNADTGIFTITGTVSHIQDPGATYSIESSITMSDTFPVVVEKILNPTEPYFNNGGHTTSLTLTPLNGGSFSPLTWEGFGGPVINGDRIDFNIGFNRGSFSGFGWLAPFGAPEDHINFQDWIFVIVPFVEPECADCEGGVTELTLQYTGDEAAFVTARKGKDGLLFSGLLYPGDVFTVAGNVQIGTDICGDVEGGDDHGGDDHVGDDHGGDDHGGDDHGGRGRHGKARGGRDRGGDDHGGDDHGGDDHGGDDHGGGDRGGDDLKLGKEIKLTIDCVDSTTIHTSCSKPIGPGSVFGDFEVISGMSLFGGPLCPASDSDSELCEDGKPQILGLLYTGQDCSGTAHQQDPSKVVCTDFGALGTDDVIIIATDKADIDDQNGHEWFNDVVVLGDTFFIDANAAGRNLLGSKTFIHIMNLDGDLLQKVEFHTSCSQPLNLGDVYGAIEVVDFSRGTKTTDNDRDIGHDGAGGDKGGGCASTGIFGNKQDSPYPGGDVLVLALALGLLTVSRFRANRRDRARSMPRFHG